MFRMAGVAVFALGVALLVMGVSSADSIGSSFSRFFTGNPSDKSIWLMLGGLVCILSGAGGFLVFRSPSSPS
jgi:LPXTG-motif cell wall-anchored protein